MACQPWRETGRMIIASVTTQQNNNEADGLDAVKRVWAACAPAPSSHPYLARHDLPSGQLRVWRDCLIAPLRNASDQMLGLLIVDADGESRSWLPLGGNAHCRIGEPTKTVIIAGTDLADAIALHDISGHQVLLATSAPDALALKKELTGSTRSVRVLIAGLTMTEAAEHVLPGMWSQDFVLLPTGRSWASLRSQLGPQAMRNWIDDPILVFPDATPGRSMWVRRSGTWIRDEEGHFCRICGPLMTTAMIRNARGTDWSRLIWLIDRDGAERWLRIAERDIVMSWQRTMAQLVDAGLDIGAVEKMPSIIGGLRAATIAARLRLVERGGWHGQHYLAQTGTVGPCSADMPVRTGRLGAAPASNPTKLVQWQEDVAALVQGNSRLVLAVCAALAGLAIGLLDGQESFGLHLRGRSSSGKSTALAVAASVFGPAGREISSWRTTENGIEATAEQHHHRLLILDEIAQIDARAAAQVGYTLGNGLGKQRANGAGRSARSATWQSIFLSAGEISLEEKIAEWAGAPAMREGQVVRVMDLPADAGKGLGIFDTLHSHADGGSLSDHFKKVASTSTGDVAIAFAERLARDVEASRLALIELQSRFVADHMPDDADGLTRRAMGHFGLLAAAGEVAIRAGILPWHDGHCMEQVAQCARDWVLARSINRGPDAISLARDWLERHGATLPPWETASGNPKADLGYVRKEPLFFYLRPEGWRALCDGGDASMIHDGLTQAGLIRNDPARLPGGKLMRFRIIDGRILDGIAGKRERP